ncbi:MAG TPA: hypothetical protein VH500_03085 [Nitrososphaeraceae archaeon]
MKTLFGSAEFLDKLGGAQQICIRKHLSNIILDERIGFSLVYCSCRCLSSPISVPSALHVPPRPNVCNQGYWDARNAYMNGGYFDDYCVAGDNH